MANVRRGEIDACIDGHSYTLCLTLGALAELETAFAAEDLMELAERFSAHRLSAADLVKILTAGLKGGGHDLTAQEVAEMRMEGGAAGFVRLAVDLLSVTFGTPQQDQGAMPPSMTARMPPHPSAPLSHGMI